MLIMYIMLNNELGNKISRKIYITSFTKYNMNALIAIEKLEKTEKLY